MKAMGYESKYSIQSRSRPQPTTKSQLYDLHNLGKGEKEERGKQFLEAVQGGQL